MSGSALHTPLLLLWFLAVTGTVLPLAAQSKAMLSVSGQRGEVAVTQINGRSYVDIEALAQLTNGSLRFNGNQITLTLPTSTAAAPIEAPSASQPANPGFSKDFLKAGIEEMTVIREWRSTLLSAVQNGYPVTDALVSGFQSQATANLRLASVAASTDSDQKAFQLLSNEFDNMQRLCDKIVAARENMNYIAPNALKDDPLYQKILNCARSLASMASSGQFQDDGVCH